MDEIKENWLGIELTENAIRNLSKKSLFSIKRFSLSETDFIFIDLFFIFP